MKTKVLIIFSSIIMSFLSYSQQGDGGKPKSLTLESIDLRVFEEPNIDSLRIEDSRVDGKGIDPWRFGFNHYTNLNMNNSGSWIKLNDGGSLWLLKIVCKEALTINLTLDNVLIPEGNELYVYNENKSFILGKFKKNHLYKGELGTELVPGDVAIIEYYIPKENLQLKKNLNINTVTHGYRSSNEFINFLKGFDDSGNCNMNVNCPDGWDWEYQKRSAVMLVSGSSGFCSGALINNTQNDGTPYVLTANHCYSNPTSWVFRFNWESNGCSNPPSSPSFQSLSGAILRARRTPSDFCLVEITGGLSGGTIPSSFNAFFSGWNNQNIPPTSSVCIHHPSGDIKKIAFDDNPGNSVTAMGSSENNSSWEVRWDRNTTTEGGSSGAPLYDQNKRIIGQLWGGSASCFNLNGPDWYGKLSSSWNPSGSSNSKQLKYWLDPLGSGIGSIDGFYVGQDASLNAPDSNIYFELYPNPNNGIINIKLNTNDYKGYNLYIKDLMGRIVFESELDSFNSLINLNKLNNGTYLSVLKTNNTEYTKAFILNK